MAIRRCLITGTHGCGKSTLSHRICSELKRKGYNAIVISETARESPFPINKGQTVESTLYIALKQAVKELEAIAHGYTYLVLDRGVLDSFFYSEATRQHPITDLEKHLLSALTTWTQDYDEIILLTGEGKETLEADGVRDTDRQFAQNVEDLLKKFFLEKFGDRVCMLSYPEMLACDIHINEDGKIVLKDA